MNAFLEFGSAMSSQRKQLEQDTCRPLILLWVQGMSGWIEHQAVLVPSSLQQISRVLSICVWTQMYFPVPHVFG